MEQAGADRGLLLLASGEEPTIKAQAAINGDRIFVQVRDEPVTATMLPQSMLHYVLRTRESVILDDAVNEGSFGSDPYIRQRRVRSALCLPLINRGELIGVLYLENNLAPRVFAPGRLAVLRLLASQAAIALENARLYRDLAEREAKIRRLVDANIVGIFIFALEGRIIEANDAFLHMVGYDREDLISGRIRWTDLTPPEWLDRDTRQWVPELMRTGILPPFEKEYFRKDGTRVPVMIGVASVEEAGHQGVTFVLDLTERKRAEEALRDAQMELAHANRVATMGQLIASIAHEVNQPISAAVIGAQAALRWLDAQPPDLKEVRQALERVVKDGYRAGAVLGRIRGIVKKAPSRMDGVDINEAVREVIELTRGEAVKNGVAVQTEIANGLPLIEGDRVQLQQVLLNLIMNAFEAMSDVSDGAREVLISTRNAGTNGVLVAVRDSGPGLAPAVAERVFSPFYTTKPTGLGIGLSISHSIIEAHGGRLWVNENLPRGVTFQFTVPATNSAS
jgi:PAS domain S-box-containing protein